MDLIFKPFDGRKPNVMDVIDQESNRIVGKIYSNWSWPGIEISLFDRKYESAVNTVHNCRILSRAG